jgi:hypothetical protein
MTQHDGVPGHFTGMTDHAATATVVPSFQRVEEYHYLHTAAAAAPNSAKEGCRPCVLERF